MELKKPDHDIYSRYRLRYMMEDNEKIGAVWTNSLSIYHPEGDIELTKAELIEILDLMDEYPFGRRK